MNRNKSILFVAVVLGLLGQGSCGHSAMVAPSGLPMTSMQIGSRTYQLEIAADEPSREHGLMERDSMDRDHGMIFVTEQPDTTPFWMHHTRFPLDIVFADINQKVLTVTTMKAYDESSTYSDGAYKYAIELSSGETAANGVKRGDQLQIPPEVDAALTKK